MSYRRSDVVKDLRAGIIRIQRASLPGSIEQVNLIGYCCDIEGNLQYWENYLCISQVVRRRAGLIELRDGCHFVFGGDVCDRGIGDIRVIRDIVELKNRYPDRVHVIMGNRDINKMRMRFELAEQTLQTSSGNVYWVPRVPHTGNTGPEKLNWMLLNTLGCPLTFGLRRQELGLISGRPEAEITDDMVVQSFLDLMTPHGLLTKYLAGAKLGTVLADVCFCHGALHQRNLGKIPPSLYTSIEQSHRSPEAETEVRRCGDVSRELLVEPLTESQRKEGWKICTGSIHEWFDELNAFAAREIEHYISESDEFLERMNLREFWHSLPPPPPPDTVVLSKCKSEGSVSVCSQDDQEDVCRSGGSYWALVGGFDHPQPGSRLLQYGMGWTPDKQKIPTVVYENWLNDEAEPMVPSPVITEYLKCSGVRYVTTGHQPHGDSPLVMVSPDVIYIAADTSYSKNVTWEEDVGGKKTCRETDGSRLAVNRDTFIPSYSEVINAGMTRGVSVSEVCFEIEGVIDSRSSGKVSLAFSHGIVSNGDSYTFPLRHSAPDCDHASARTRSNLLCNQDIDCDWWIKGLGVVPSPQVDDAGNEKTEDAPRKSGYLASKSAKFTVMNKYFSCSSLDS